MSFRETYDEIESLSEKVKLRDDERAFILANPHLPLSLDPGALSPNAEKVKDCIDECADQIMATFKAHGLKANGSDPIERVVEAIAKFALESGNPISL